jgi:hypothetical protein
MKKKISRFSIFLLLSAFLFFPFFISAQVPEDTAALQPKDSVKVWIGKQVSSIRYANGYMKQFNGKWAQLPNEIPFDDPDYNNPYYDRYKIGIENFQQISLYQAKIDSLPYYLLFIRYLKGDYKDQENKTGFHTWYMADYYFIKPEAIRNAFPDTVKFGKYFPITLRVWYPGLIPINNMKDLQMKVNWDVNNNLRTAHLYDTTVKPFFRFLTYPFKSPKYGDFVRFNTSLAYARTGEKPAMPSWYIFDTQYYQLTFDKFKLLFRTKE